MQHLFLALTLLTACGGDSVEIKDILEGEPNEPSVQAPIAEMIEEPVLDQKVAVNERTDCPSPIIHQPLLERTYSALTDESNKDKFDEWEGSFRVSGNAVEATWSYKGVYYKVFWVDHEHAPGDGFAAFWERTDRPFVVGGDIDLIGSDTYMDASFTGCANFGIAYYDAEPGKMQWNHGDNWQLQYHDDWQARYGTAVDGLAITLGVK